MTWRLVLFSLLILMAAACRPLIAQQIPKLSNTRQTQATPERPGTMDEGSDVGQGPVLLGVACLLFGITIIGIMAYMRVKQSIDMAVFTKIAGLALVLSVGLSLIVVGYSQQQVAPMMGLLGTVAGYLLGRTDEPVSPAGKPPTGG